MIALYLRQLYLLIDGSNPKGIRIRTWFSIILSLVCIAADSIYVYTVYDYMPRVVPGLNDWDGKVLEWVSKSEFFEYEIERIIVLFVMLAIGFGITTIWKKSLIAKRTRCLMTETAMLIITTGVGISVAQLALTMGDSDDKISDYWEWSIMLFWFALLLVEVFFDYKRLKKRGK